MGNEAPEEPVEERDNPSPIPELVTEDPRIRGYELKHGGDEAGRGESQDPQQEWGLTVSNHLVTSRSCPSSGAGVVSFLLCHACQLFRTGTRDSVVAGIGAHAGLGALIFLQHSQCISHAPGTFYFSGPPGPWEKTCIMQKPATKWPVTLWLLQTHERPRRRPDFIASTTCVF